MLALDAARGVAAHDLRPETVRRSGARILARLLATATGRPAGAAGAAGTLAAAWAPEVEAAAGAARRSLIVSADHELNVSAFAARCVASAGSDAAGRGVGRNRGAERGARGPARRVGPGAARRRRRPRRPAALAAGVRRHGVLPGFAGLPVYADGDPRATLLLDRIRAAMPGALGVSDAVVAAARAELGVQPSADYARAVVASVLDLPRGAELALFALGRTAGLVAHALEHTPRDRLIRPRARYVGPRPASKNSRASAVTTAAMATGQERGAEAQRHQRRADAGDAGVSTISRSPPTVFTTTSAASSAGASTDSGEAIRAGSSREPRSTGPAPLMATVASPTTTTRIQASLTARSSGRG